MMRIFLKNFYLKTRRFSVEFISFGRKFPVKSVENNVLLQVQKRQHNDKKRENTTLFDEFRSFMTSNGACSNIVKKITIWKFISQKTAQNV